MIEIARLGREGGGGLENLSVTVRLWEIFAGVRL